VADADVLLVGSPAMGQASAALMSRAEHDDAIQESAI
jgi:hypothetical protein